MTHPRRVFLAGASSLIGVRIIPLLLEAGDTVAAMTRTPAKADALRALGAEPVVVDAFDRDALTATVGAFAPDVVLHNLTDLPDRAADLPAARPAHARLLRAGTRNLVDAAGGARIVAQSIAWKADGETGSAYEELERAVLDADGVVVRFGQFFGPGTYFPDGPPDPPRIHVDEAARRAVAAIDEPSGVIVATDHAPDRHELGTITR